MLQEKFIHESWVLFIIIVFKSFLLTLIGNFFYQVDLSNQPNFIEADKPIMVAQYITTAGACGNTSIGGDGDPEVIYLSPVAKAMKDLFTNINVVVDKKDYTILRMEMVEAGGDNTIIRFTNKQINIPVADALFAIK